MSIGHSLIAFIPDGQSSQDLFHVTVGLINFDLEYASNMCFSRQKGNPNIIGVTIAND
jgi:hypothetical protein